MSMDPGGQNAGVLITMGRVYEEVTAARRDISSLDSKVEQALRAATDHEARVRTLEKDSATKEDLAALAARVQTVERGSWKTRGATAAVSVLVSSGIATLIATKALGH